MGSLFLKLNPATLSKASRECQRQNSRQGATEPAASDFHGQTVGGWLYSLRLQHPEKIHPEFGASPTRCHYWDFLPPSSSEIPLGRTRWRRSRWTWSTFISTDISGIHLQTQKYMQNTSWEQTEVTYKQQQQQQQQQQSTPRRDAVNVTYVFRLHLWS